MTELDHERHFQQAWDDPGNTRYELPAVDVNRVLAERYTLDKPLVFTRTMMWDNEVRKARRPDLFIPSVVAAGSADAWGDGDIFVRRSMQRQWSRPGNYGLVLEQTRLDHARQVVTFIGAADHPGRDGAVLHASTEQPIFHVEHSVSGEESRPLNNWRTVHVTGAPDGRIVEVFDRIAANPWLPEFVEIYIRDVLELAIARRDAVE